MTAVRKDNHMSQDEFFYNRSSLMVYVSMMSRECLNLFIQCFRIGDKSIQPTLREDVIIPVRII